MFYPPFASAVSPVRISDIAGRKGWGTQSVVGMLRPFSLKLPEAAWERDTFSGSFDSPSLLLSLVLAQDWAGVGGCFRAAHNAINAVPACQKQFHATGDMLLNSNASESRGRLFNPSFPAATSPNCSILSESRAEERREGESKDLENVSPSHADSGSFNHER